MTDDELIEQLRNANPFGSTGDLPQPTTSKSARFEEIIMTTPTTTAPRSNPAAAPRFWKNPRLVAPTALAIAAIVAVSALLASAATAPSAQALVTDAVAQSATFDSGRMTLVVELESIPDNDADFERIEMEHRFEGANFANALSFHGAGFTETLRTIRVDGTDYIQLRTTDGWEGDWEEGSESFGLNPETFGPASALPILESAEDYALDATSDGTDVYTATVPTRVVLAIPEAELPPGLALLSGEDTEEAMLPETLGIEVWVENGQLTRMIVEISSDSNVEIEATITTTFDQLGEPQDIVVPDQS